MRLIKNLIKEGHTEFSKEELKNIYFYIRDLYVANKQEGASIIVSYIKDNQYMDISDGKYYQECDLVKKVPFEMYCMNALNRMQISTWACLQAPFLARILKEESKTQVIDLRR